MASCAHCGQRKGKRSCPALSGSICTPCCGKHRRREIRCKEGCPHLPTREALGALIDLAQTKVLTFALEDLAFAADATDAFLGPGRTVEDWEQASLGGWITCGHEAGGGERAVERFLRLRGGDLKEEERAVLESLAAARPALLEVLEVVRDERITFRDVLSGEEVRVREKLGTHQLRSGQRALAWLMELDAVTMLTGASTLVPPAHAELVERSLRSAVERERLKGQAAAQAVLVRRSLPEVHRALRKAVEEWVPPAVVNSEGLEVGVYRAVYQLLDEGKVRERLAAQPGLVPLDADQFVWLDPRPPALPRTTGEGEVHGEIYAATDAGPARVLGRLELKTVRLTLECTTEEYLEVGKAALERDLRGLVRHRVDHGETAQDHFLREKELGRPDSSERRRETIDLDPDASLEERHAKILAELDRLGREAPPVPLSLEREEEVVPPAPHRLPPLAHDRLGELVPGLEVLVRDEARAFRQEPGWELRSVPTAKVKGLPAVQRFLEEHARALLGRGASHDAACDDADFLGHQIHVLLNHEVHRRKTFWVDPSLAWALLETELDIQGGCLRLPFPACAFVFSDRSTLELGESLLSQDPDCPIREKPLALVTAYASAGEGTPEAGQEVSLAFFFDAGEGTWPYMITRGLFVRPEDDLARILDSHAPSVDEDDLDPVFLAPELLKLVHLVVNAILYATSAHLDRANVAPATRDARPQGGEGKAVFSREEVFFLPGKIAISRVARLRELGSTETGRTILKRFMVRGHWHRALPTWKDAAPLDRALLEGTGPRDRDRAGVQAEAMSRLSDPLICAKARMPEPSSAG